METKFLQERNKMSQELKQEKELTTLNIYREDLALVNAVKDILGFNTLPDLAKFLLSLAVGEVEKRERERSEVFPIMPDVTISGNMVTGWKCAFCAEQGIGDFVFRSKADFLDHQEVDRDLIDSGRYGALTLASPDERKRYHESLREKKKAEHEARYKAVKEAIIK
jgi:hypothetical protein